jgi:hypothetical protein
MLWSWRTNTSAASISSRCRRIIWLLIDLPLASIICYLLLNTSLQFRTVRNVSLNIYLYLGNEHFTWIKLLLILFAVMSFIHVILVGLFVDSEGLFRSTNGAVPTTGNSVAFYVGCLLFHAVIWRYARGFKCLYLNTLKPDRHVPELFRPLCMI